MNVISVTQAAKKWGVSRQRVLVWCQTGRIPGAALKMHLDRPFWEIPENSEKPESLLPYGVKRQSEKK